MYEIPVFWWLHGTFPVVELQLGFTAILDAFSQVLSHEFNTQPAKLISTGIAVASSRSHPDGIKNMSGRV